MGVTKLHIQEFAILADFDGTVILQDSNDAIFEAFGNEESAKAEQAYQEGRLNNQETVTTHFREMQITSEQYYEFLDANIRLDPGFDAFLEQVREHELPFAIVSGGFRQGIWHILGESRLQGVTVYANDVVGTPYLKPAFATDNPACEKPFGPCGNCKQICIAKVRQATGRNILYIGDGMTDRCAAEAADVLFAKDSLAAYCQARNLPYISFEQFADITDYLWTTEKREQP